MATKRGTYGDDGKGIHSVDFGSAGQSTGGTLVLGDFEIDHPARVSLVLGFCYLHGGSLMLIRGGLLLMAAVAVGAMPAYAADMEVQVVDKNCWIEIFEDDNFDADDPHVKLQGPDGHVAV